MEKMTRIDDVGWTLWASSYPVYRKFWRAPVEEAHRRFQEVLSLSVEPNEADDDSPAMPSDKIIDAIGEISELPTAPPPLGLARRRLRQEKLREMLDIAVSTVIGSFQGQEHDAAETAKTNDLMGRLLGVDPAAHKAKVPIISVLPIDGETLIEQLQLMSPLLPEIGSPEFLDQLSDVDLEKARDELKFLFTCFVALRKTEAQNHAEKAPDVELVVQLLQGLKPWQHAMALLIWLSVRRVPGWSEKLQLLIDCPRVQLHKDLT
jgi:hypothetical protein